MLPLVLHDCATGSSHSIPLIAKVQVQCAWSTHISQMSKCVGNKNIFNKNIPKNGNGFHEHPFMLFCYLWLYFNRIGRHWYKKKISGISLHILSTQFLYYVVACNSFYISWNSLLAILQCSWKLYNEYKNKSRIIIAFCKSIYLYTYKTLITLIVCLFVWLLVCLFVWGRAYGSWIRNGYSNL